MVNGKKKYLKYSGTIVPSIEKTKNKYIKYTQPDIIEHVYYGLYIVIILISPEKAYVSIKNNNYKMNSIK